MSAAVSRTDVFNLVADGVAGGLVPPWRFYLAPGCQYLSISVVDAAEWAAWRHHLGCPDLTIQLYEAGGALRRSSVAEMVRDGCRIAVELVEDLQTGALLPPPTRPGPAT
jgi:hypothetical protein